MSVQLPYRMNDSLEKNVIVLTQQISSLLGENAALREIRAKGLVSKIKESALTKTCIENSRAVQELSLLRSALTLPPDYDMPNSYTYERNLISSQILCGKIHKKCLEFFECYDSFRKLSSTAASAEEKDALISKRKTIKNEINELIQNLKELCQIPMDNDYRTKISIIDDQYKQIRSLESENKSLKSQLAQEQRTASSSHKSSTLATIIIIVLLFANGWLTAQRDSYKEDLQALQEEYSDYEYYTDEAIWDASENYSDLLTQYDDLDSYANYLEDELERVNESLEEAEDILEELDSYGVLDRYGIYY